MRPVPLLAIALAALALSGCVTTQDTPKGLGPIERAPLAELPPGGQVFLVLHWGCGMQPWPQGDLLVTLGNGTLYAFRVEERHDQAVQAGDVRVPAGEAERVLRAAHATGGFNLSRYEREASGYVILRSDARTLASTELDRLRAAVTGAGFQALRGFYPGDGDIVDGCTYDHGAWVDGRYHAVSAIDNGGPEGLEALRDLYRGLAPAA